MDFLKFTKKRQFSYLVFGGLSLIFTLNSFIINIISAFVGGWIQIRPDVYIASFDKNPGYVWFTTLFQLGVMITELITLILLISFIFLKKEMWKRHSILTAILSLVLSMELLIFIMIWYPPHAMSHLKNEPFRQDVTLQLSSFYFNLYFVVICDAFAITSAILAFKEYNAFAQYIPAESIYHTPIGEDGKGSYIGLKY